MDIETANAVFLQHGIPKASTMDKENLKSLYRKLVLKTHPDIGGSDEDMRWINAAYDTLKNTPLSVPVASVTPDPHAGRTMPKTPQTKGGLVLVRFEFRFEDDDSVITYGVGDFYDLLKILNLAEDMGVGVSYNPLEPINPKTGEWTSKNIIVYFNTKGIDPVGRRNVTRLVRLQVRRNFSNVR